MTFDLDIWQVDWTWPSLGQVQRSRSQVRVHAVQDEKFLFGYGCTLQGETRRPRLKSRPGFETVNK